jgi:hypothetical protein
MKRKLIYGLCLLLLTAVTAAAQEQGRAPASAKATPAAKELSGMSIVGNDEAPKSLYIVPWKSSELGVETSLNMMLSADDVPVDREVFLRQLEFYQVSTAQPSTAPRLAGDGG